MNKINLEFDKQLTRLAGNLFGEEIYNNQVKKNIKWNEKNEIIFPIDICPGNGNNEEKDRQRRSISCSAKRCITAGRAWGWEFWVCC